jgi:hypothetical protein
MRLSATVSQIERMDFITSTVVWAGPWFSLRDPGNTRGDLCGDEHRVIPSDLITIRFVNTLANMTLSREVEEVTWSSLSLSFS